jgi:hypothetical protein
MPHLLFVPKVADPFEGNGENEAAGNFLSLEAAGSSLPPFAELLSAPAPASSSSAAPATSSSETAKQAADQVIGVIYKIRQPISPDSIAMMSKSNVSIPILPGFLDQDGKNWPQSCNLHCFHCTYPFEGRPIPMVVGVRTQDSAFRVKRSAAAGTDAVILTCLPFRQGVLLFQLCQDPRQRTVLPEWR